MSENNNCIAILKSGERANQQCGSKVSDGTTFCKRHSTSTSSDSSSATTIKPPKTKKGAQIDVLEETEIAVSEPVKKKTSTPR